MINIFHRKNKIIDTMDVKEKEYFFHLLKDFHDNGIFIYLDRLGDMEKWQGKYKGFRYEYEPIKGIIKYFYHKEILDKNSCFYQYSNVKNEMAKKCIYSDSTINIVSLIKKNMIKNWLFFKSNEMIRRELKIPKRTVEAGMKKIKEVLDIDYLMVPTKAMNSHIIYINNKHTKGFRIVVTKSFMEFVYKLKYIMIKNKIKTGSHYLENKFISIKDINFYHIQNLNHIIFAFKESGIINVSEFSKDVLPFNIYKTKKGNER